MRIIEKILNINTESFLPFALYALVFYLKIPKAESFFLLYLEIILYGLLDKVDNP